MKRRARAQRRGRGDDDMPPPASGYVLEISHIGKRGVRHQLLSVDVADLLQMQKFWGRPLKMTALEISVRGPA